ncbi:MAG: hypothetical protein PUC12_00220 [Clostridiales bacterium]|nr:hypothetical protein [Clostridiales bacterium]
MDGEVEIMDMSFEVSKVFQERLSSGECGGVVKLSFKKDTPKIEVTMKPDEESDFTSEERISSILRDSID